MAPSDVATPARAPEPVPAPGSPATALEQQAIDVVRGLAMDAPQAANSGHPGTAMALAPLAHVLFHRVMQHDPTAPDWPDRDRFILSAGHASILLYSMLHLTGYPLELEDLRAFRQWGSRTPGHPEVHHTVGVEVTTGPLGQGFANGVGMGVAERYLRARFGAEVCDHRTFVICSDGDLMEGISHEAASLAGHLGLGRLVYVYDDNRITIDGGTDLAFTDDNAARFRAYGWHVVEAGDVANDVGAIEEAVREAMAEEDRPSLVVLRSHIGWPSPTKTDTAAAHGSPFGEEEIRATKERLGLPPDETFWVPDEVRSLYLASAERGRAAREAWEQRRAAWQGDEAALEACLQGKPLPGWDEALPTWQVGERVATRVASGKVLAAIAEKVPALLPGSADLTDNTGTRIDAEPQMAATPAGRQLYYGVREHAMAAAMNGMALHGGVIPVAGTFLIFSDYMKPAVRLAAMSEAKVIYSWTHDSVGLGEDGPTHQPVEQLAGLRAIPGLRVVRPADPNEVVEAWRVALASEGPTALVLTRQAVPVLEGTAERAVGLREGAYVLVEPEDGYPDVVLLGTGSEVHTCVEAAALLAADGIQARVVSMPCWELFSAQPEEHQIAVLPPELPVLAVEAASSFGWERWADDVVALDRFGASAPGATALERLGFEPGNVADRARQLIAELEGIAPYEDDTEVHG